MLSRIIYSNKKNIILATKQVHSIINYPLWKTLLGIYKKERKTLVMDFVSKFRRHVNRIYLGEAF